MEDLRRKRGPRQTNREPRESEPLGERLPEAEYTPGGSSGDAEGQEFVPPVPITLNEAAFSLDLARAEAAAWFVEAERAIVAALDQPAELAVWARPLAALCASDCLDRDSVVERLQDKLRRFGTADAVTEAFDAAGAVEPAFPEDLTLPESAQVKVRRPRTREDRVRERAEAIEIEEEARARVRERKAPPRSPLEALTVAESARLPKTEWRVEGLVPGKGFLNLVAQAKTGKTTVLGNLGRSMLTGEPFLGRFATRPLDGSIVMLNYELDPQTLGRWYEAMGLGDRFHLVHLRGLANPLATQEGREELRELLRSREAQAMFTDPFSRAYTGQSQNDAQEVQNWMNDLDALARSAGVEDVVLTVHTGWDNSRIRGTTALKDHPDSLITLTREGDTRYLEAEGRDVEQGKGTLHLDPATRLLTFTPPEVEEAGKAAARDLAREAKREEWAEEKVRAILALLRDNPDGLSKSAIHDAVGGRRVNVLALIDSMADALEIEVEGQRVTLLDDLL